MTVTLSKRGGSLMSTLCPRTSIAEFAVYQDIASCAVITDTMSRLMTRDPSAHDCPAVRSSLGLVFLTSNAAEIHPFVATDAYVQDRGCPKDSWARRRGAVSRIPLCPPQRRFQSSTVLGATIQDGLVCGDVSTDTSQVEIFQSAEWREVRTRKSRLGHGEVYRMDSVSSSIRGGPRPPSG